MSRLLAAYPDHLAAVEGNDLVWRDGHRMAISDGNPEKTFEDRLERPDIADMLRQTYPAGAPAAAPPRNFDPGRARNEAFFDRMYGDCRKGGVDRHLVDVLWLPGKARGGQRLRVTSANGVAAALKRVSDILDRLPQRFDVFLLPAAGTYNCRTIAGTSRRSAHGYGIAIDIALPRSHYWRNGPTRADGSPEFRNAIPLEIVSAFEANGFIWGGRWHHFDTMHFEYRPELLPVTPDRAPAPPNAPAAGSPTPDPQHPGPLR